MQASSLRTLPASVVCASVLAKPEAFLAEVALRLKTATVFGSIDCALRHALRFTQTPLLRHGVGHSVLRLWLQTISDGCTLANADTSGHAYGVATLPLRCHPETSACFFRLVVAAALLSFLRSAQDADCLVLPTHR